MRGRSINRWLILVLILVLLAGLGYALFPFLVDEERYRRPLEAGASFALGRRVTIEGPISLGLSLHPTLVLEDVHIANPSWASRHDLLQATRLEAQLSFLALLRRKLVIDKIFIDGVDLLLEEGPHESNNWTFAAPSEPDASSKVESRITATITEEGFVGMQRVTIAYQPYMASGPESSLTIIEGSVSPGDDRTRKFSVRGTFRDTPFTIEMIGGKFFDLLDLTEPWPIDGVLVAADTTLKAKGQLNDFNNDPYLEITGSLSGADLSSLDPLFQTDLPPYGPYELITSLSLSENTLILENSRLKVGQTDLSGLFIMDFKEDRTHYHSRLTGKTLQTKDFQSSESENNPADTSPPSPQSFAKQIGMAGIDIDLELAVNKFLVDTQNFGKISLSAKLKEGLLRVTPFRAETFGGVFVGRFELDGNHPGPSVTLEAMALDWDFGQALQAFDVNSEIAGSTDLDITLRGQGATFQEFLDHTTLSLNAGPSSLVFGNKENSEKTVVGINQATVTAVQGEAIKARVDGTIMEKTIDVALVAGSLTQLHTPDTPWPISLLVRSEDASLIIKGGLKSEVEEMRAALAVSLSGQKLNRLAPDLPPSGPYVFRAELINSGSEYFLKDLKGRLGQSDVTGFVSLDMEEDVPHLSAAFSSAYLNMADLSTPGDIIIPVESLQDLVADFTWNITRLRAETLQLGDLAVNGTLKNGQLAFTTLKGKLFDRKHTYAEFQGELTLDTTTDIPTLSGSTLFHPLDFGHLLQRFGSNEQVVGVANLDAHFSSKGKTLFTLLGQPTFTIGTQDLHITLNDQHDEPEILLNLAQAALSSNDGGPLLLRAEGSFKEAPFTIASSSGDLSQLMKEIPQWPLAMTIQFPELLIDLSGHLLFPMNSENFSFQVFVKGDGWNELSLLSEMELPDFGPLRLAGLVTQIHEGYRVTELKGELGPNDFAGDLTFLTNGLRPKLLASLSTESNELGFLTKKNSTSIASEKSTILESIGDSVAKIGSGVGKAVADMGSKAGEMVVQSMGLGKKDDKDKTPVVRIIPDFEFPVAALRSIDLDLDWQVQQVQSKGIHLGNFSFKLTLENGFLTIGPLTGTLWKGSIDSKIELDASQYVPNLTVHLTIQDLDMNFLDDTVGVTNLVTGEVDLISLNLKSRGTTLHEALSRANGKAELVEGPFEITNKYIEFWAADLLTLALTKAWEKEEVTKLNCAVGYFDINEGEIQSDAILFDTQRITVGGFGTLNLRNEQIDLILTPQPKNPTLATLANPVRITGHLSDPDVTSDKLRIAQGGGWYLLGLVNPIGLTIVIPKIAGTTLGTGKENPCAIAMSDKKFTVQEVSELQEDFWDWMIRKMKGVFTSNGDTKKPSPNSENREP